MPIRIILIICAFMLLIPAAQAKDLVCHKGKTLTVGKLAVLFGHLNHGDTLGVCEETEEVGACECPPGIAHCTCADGSPGKASDTKPTFASPGHMRLIYGS